MRAAWVGLFLVACRGGLGLGPVHRSWKGDTVTHVAVEAGGVMRNGFGGFATYHSNGTGNESEQHLGGRIWLLAEPRYRHAVYALSPTGRLYAAGGAGIGPTFSSSQATRVRAVAIAGHTEFGIQLDSDAVAFDISLRYRPVADYDESEGPEWNHALQLALTIGRK